MHTMFYFNEDAETYQYIESTYYSSYGNSFSVYPREKKENVLKESEQQTQLPLLPYI